MQSKIVADLRYELYKFTMATAGLAAAQATLNLSKNKEFNISQFEKEYEDSKEKLENIIFLIDTKLKD